ncbi:MAG: prepilin-type N-terminal cleavage/methylation domain-containing protein [Pseudomonadota bacterium]
MRSSSKAQKGFSLLELIASLAIVSLVSAALFQSAGQWFRLSARAADAADQTVQRVTDQSLFEYAVSGLAPAWPEQTELLFRGDRNGFSGLSRTPLQTAAPAFVFINISIDRSHAGASVIYASGDTRWNLLSPIGADAGFSYLGADGAWRDTWPPAVNPEPGPFNDAAFYSIPQTPLAIRLIADDVRQRRVWIADVKSAPHLTTRLRDLENRLE